MPSPRFINLVPRVFRLPTRGSGVRPLPLVGRRKTLGTRLQIYYFTFSERLSTKLELAYGSFSVSFFLPRLCYHPSIVRKISSLSFQLTSLQLKVPINELLDRLLILSSKGRQHSEYVCSCKRIISSVFSGYLQNTPLKSNALLSDMTTRPYRKIMRLRCSRREI